MAQGTVQTNAAPAADPKAGLPPTNGTANGLTQPPKPGETTITQPPKPGEQTRTIKVNGKEYQVTETQLIALAQKGMFADQSLKSIDVLKKSSASILARLKTPDGIIGLAKEAGITEDALIDKLVDSGAISEQAGEKLSLWVYKNKVEPAKLTPEQIEDRKKLEEYGRLKKADEERKKLDAESKQKSQVTQIYQAVRTEVVKQITADKTFPQIEGSIRQVIDKLRVMNRNKVPLTPQAIAKAMELVKKDHILFQQSILDGDKDQPDYGERLISRIGEERALAISRALIARLKAKTKAAVKTETNGEEKKEGLEESLNRKYNKTKSGLTVMNW
ncbi:MAG: hypothetical protein KGL39_20045 [Patescibacteria group bacterium]|nr:hypothetical protein [Patescibacteria group bacterium]